MTVGVLYIALLQWLRLAVHNTCCNKWPWLCPAVHCTHCNDCDCTWLYTIHVAMTVTVPGCTLYMLQWLWLYLAVHCTRCNDCACCLPIAAHSTPGSDCTLLHNSCTFSAHRRGPARHSITAACCTRVCDSAPCSTVGVWRHNAAATPCTAPLWLDAQRTLQWLCPCTLLAIHCTCCSDCACCSRMPALPGPPGLCAVHQSPPVGHGVGPTVMSALTGWTCCSW